MTSDAIAKAGAATSRKIQFYLLAATLIVDASASRGASLMHLTLWSWMIHTLYFELASDEYALTRLLHGPSLGGAFALCNMYIWTMIANPNMEFDLAPKGRAPWVVYVRAVWLHFAPVLLHLRDIQAHRSVLLKSYAGYSKHKALMFWACIGGYFAMGLTWEQVAAKSGNGGAAGTYNVTLVSPEVYVNVSKAIGVVSCLVSYWVFTKPLFQQSG